MKHDPIVDEVRANRAKLASRFNNDVGAIVRDARRRQSKAGRRVVSFATRSRKAS